MAKSTGKKIGTKASQDTKYMFGTDQEIANRDKVGYQPGATSFAQISPADRGGNLAEAGTSAPVKSGNFKFSPGV